MNEQKRISPATLLAIGVALDLVWVGVFHSLPADHYAAVLIGLVYGQLSAATIWADFSHRSLGLRIIVVAVAVLFGARLIVAREPEPYRVWIGVLGSHVVLLTLFLRPMIRLHGSRLANGVSADRPWQFSMRYMLISMTALAILLAALSGNRMLARVWPFVVAFVATNASIGLAAVTLLGWLRPWPVRCAILLGIAGLLGAILGAVQGEGDSQLLISFCVIHAITLEIGLTFSPLVPTTEPTRAVE